MILNKNDNILKLNQILDDTLKFKRLHLEQDEVLMITDLLKSLKIQNEISEKNHRNLYSSGSNPEILYGFGKILEDGIPSICPILSAIDKSTCN